MLCYVTSRLPVTGRAWACTSVRWRAWHALLFIQLVRKADHYWRSLRTKPGCHPKYSSVYPSYTQAFLYTRYELAKDRALESLGLKTPSHSRISPGGCQPGADTACWRTPIPWPFKDQHMDVHEKRSYPFVATQMLAALRGHCPTATLLSYPLPKPIPDPLLTVSLMIFGHFHFFSQNNSRPQSTTLAIMHCLK